MSEEKGRLAVITMDGCPYCDEFKKKHKNALDSGQIKELNISRDDTAVKIAKMLDIDGVPTLVSIKSDKVCKLNRTTMKEEECIPWKNK